MESRRSALVWLRPDILFEMGGFWYAERPPLDHKLFGSLVLVPITIIAGSARWSVTFCSFMLRFTHLDPSEQSFFLFEPSLSVFRFNNLIWIPVKKNCICLWLMINKTRFEIAKFKSVMAIVLNQSKLITPCGCFWDNYWQNDPLLRTNKISFLFLPSFVSLLRNNLITL